MWAPLLLGPLLAIQLHGGTAAPAVGCESEYIHVASTTELKTAEGCYRREKGSGRSGGAAVYVKEAAAEGAVYQTTVSKAPRGNSHQWRIGIQRGSESSRVLCSGLSVSASMDSPMLVNEWECGSSAGNLSARRFIFGNELVTCGCTSPQEEGLVLPTEYLARGEKSVKSHKTGARGSIRGRGSSGKGVEGIFEDATGVALVSRALEEDAGDLHSFWIWVIVAGSIAGLIVLCCVGWYIRNPFFCQKSPLPNPDAPPGEDAAPQAPKAIFQPWGASAPPK
ncbi:unnamed protein product [Ectocarpus sp. 12 AP-2014]